MSLANHQLVVVAAFLAGAASRRTDTEDIAVKANEIAPGRFTWRKYPEQINIDTVRKRLWDACKPEKGSYLTGSEREGWLLTEVGTAFARAHVAEVHPEFSTRRTSLNEKAWLRNERVRLQSTEAYEKYTTGRKSEISQREAESFFRIDDYVSANVREEKLVRLLNAFGADVELGDVIAYLAGMIREAKQV